MYKVCLFNLIVCVSTVLSAAEDFSAATHSGFVSCEFRPTTSGRLPCFVEIEHRGLMEDFMRFNPMFDHIFKFHALSSQEKRNILTKLEERLASGAYTIRDSSSRLPFFKMMAS